MRIGELARIGGVLVDGRLVSVEARITELEATRDHLRLLAQRAAEQNPAECHGYCAILQPAPAGGRGPLTYVMGKSK